MAYKRRKTASGRTGYSRGAGGVRRKSYGGKTSGGRGGQTVKLVIQHVLQSPTPVGGMPASVVAPAGSGRSRF